MFLSFQGVAVLGIALIAMGEEIGSEMALRTFGHLVSFIYIFITSSFYVIVCSIMSLSFLLIPVNL